MDAWVCKPLLVCIPSMLDTIKMNRLSDKVLFAMVIFVMVVGIWDMSRTEQIEPIIEYIDYPSHIPEYIKQIA